MHRLTRLFLALALVMSVGGLTAGMIDFNDAVSGAAYGPAVSGDGVTVNFYTGPNGLVCPCAPAGLTAAYGAQPDTVDATTTAFLNTVEGGDMRSGGGDSGFLTDESAGPIAALDYFFQFSVGLTDLSVEVLDYRGDGGAPAPVTVTLQTYSNTNWTGLTGSPFFFLGSQGADGLVIPLTDLGGGLPIRSARVTFSTPDIGTGIDNLSWTATAIPEPGTVILFGTGLLALGAIVRKRRAQA